MDQEGRDSLFIGTDSRSNFKQIIAKRSDLTKFAGGRMQYASSGIQTYNAGTLVGYASSGTYAGLYRPYLSTNTDGSQVPVGFLSDDVVTDTSGNGSEASIITGGALFQSLLIGVDSNATTLLNARVTVEHGQNIYNF